MRVLSQKQRGALMIEVMVTIAIVVVGVAGLMRMQGRLQLSEVESYQRTQALILLNDMASRISTNRWSGASYDTDALTPSYLGVGGDTTACDSTSTDLVDVDRKEWCDALKGAAEKTADDTAVGSMIGARGCVQELNTNIYMVTVAWQGLSPQAVPAETLLSADCALGEYDVAVPTDCVDNLCRRYLTTIVRVANLEAP